jgi:putative ABC transport system permease protein
MTPLRDALARCLQSILARPGRTALTAFGIGIGVAAALQLLDAMQGSGMPGRRQVPPARIPRLMVSNGERSSLAAIWATTPERARRAGLVAVEGRSLAALDLRDARRVAVIGAGLRAELFGLQSALLRPIEIGDARFTVVGVFEARGPGAGGDGEVGSDRSVVLPESSAAELASLASAPLGPPGVQGAGRRGPAGAAAVLGPVAAISLLLGGAVLACAMLATVVERKREIALRRAVGATRGEVFGECLLESVLLASAGGVVGVVAALALEPGSAAAGPPAWGAAAALPLAALLGAAAGLVPALRAARLDPAEALRAE